MDSLENLFYKLDKSIRKNLVSDSKKLLRSATPGFKNLSLEEKIILLAKTKKLISDFEPFIRYLTTDISLLENSLNQNISFFKKVHNILKLKISYSQYMKLFVPYLKLKGMRIDLQINAAAE